MTSGFTEVSKQVFHMILTSLLMKTLLMRAETTTITRSGRLRDLARRVCPMMSHSVRCVRSTTGIVQEEGASEGFVKY